MKLVPILTVALGLLVGCARETWVEGGLYYTPSEAGGFSVVKILKVDEKGVHVRVYSNGLAEPPTRIDEDSLFLAGINRQPGESLGLGHLPVSRASFALWQAVFVQQSTVADEELEGYRDWLEAKGGYF